MCAKCVKEFNGKCILLKNCKHKYHYDCFKRYVNTGRLVCLRCEKPFKVFFNSSKVLKAEDKYTDELKDRNKNIKNQNRPQKYTKKNDIHLRNNSKDDTDKDNILNDTVKTKILKSDDKDSKQVIGKQNAQSKAEFFDTVYLPMKNKEVLKYT